MPPPQASQLSSAHQLSWTFLPSLAPASTRPVPDLPADDLRSSLHLPPQAPIMERSSPVTRSITPVQLPNCCCRNSRALGYQGLSVRSNSQRQSALYGNRIQTGLPIAPARWAMLVSTEMTRSKFSITAAVLQKSNSSP